MLIAASAMQTVLAHVRPFHSQYVTARSVAPFRISMMPAPTTIALIGAKTPAAPPPMTANAPINTQPAAPIA